MAVREIRHRLPEAFLAQLDEAYSPMTVEKVLLGMSGRRDTTLRVNTLRATVQDVAKQLQKQGIKFQRVPWYRDALDLKNANERAIQKLPLYSEGGVYLQSLSSMLPPLFLAPRPGERVLDVAAAPGSKTTQMAAMMENRGSLVANEPDAIRRERLAYNLNVQGVTIAQVLAGPGERLGAQMPESFDRVLLDAPCSGEGRFLANRPITYRGWSEKAVHQCAKLQKKLLQSACEALKPGGFLVYSTCTLNEEENEEVLAWGLQTLPLKLMPPPVEVPGALPGRTGGQPASLQYSVRILPSQTMEGFFAALLQKKGKPNAS